MSAQSTAPLMTVKQYAEAKGVNRRTVMDWLGKDLLPAAFKDGRGQWFIPEDAIRLQPAPNSAQPASAAMESVSPLPMTPRPSQALPGRFPAFVTEPEAAELLGLSLWRVQHQRDELESVPWGERGKGPDSKWLVPSYVIRKFIGV